MGLVRGEDVIVTMAEYQEGVGYVYLPIGCARSVTFDISTDFIETSVTESGAFKTFLPSGKQYTGNIEGLVFLDKPKSTENTKATAVLDFSDLIDSGYFPTSNGNANAFTDYPTFEADTLGIVIAALQPNLASFLSDLNFGINIYPFNPGYTSVISGNTLIISAPLALGASINGFTAHCNYNIDGNTGTITGTFSGGTDGYFPAKYNLGLMYDKIISGEILGLKYYETDDDNHFLQKECSVYIESINETASFDNMVTFSATFKGSGAPTITYGED